MLNAVSEELIKPGKVFRESGLKRRCLVPSTGFYDWRHVYPLNKKTGLPLKTAIKYPYCVKVREAPYFFFAGIWQPWTDKETGEQVETFAIVTTAANSLMEQVHNSKKRMPTILTEDLAFEWLFEDLSEERVSEVAGYQFPSERMEAYTIHKDFRSNQDPMESVRYPELPDINNLS